MRSESWNDKILINKMKSKLWGSHTLMKAGCKMLDKFIINKRNKSCHCQNFLNM